MKVGDRVFFVRKGSSERLEARVVDLVRADSFSQLLMRIDLEDIALNEPLAPPEYLVKAYEKFSREDERSYGTLSVQVAVR